jgi:DNA anti-recombination protein RmuC
MAWDAEYMVPPETARELERELIAMTAQRDEARECLERCARAHCELGASHRNQIVKVENQRDRLAMALQELCQALLTTNPRDITELLNKAGDALQSLQTPTQTEQTK